MGKRELVNGELLTVDAVSVVTKRLLARLEAIGRAVKESGQGVALLGLGSGGLGLARLDDFSDLDFFVIAKTGCKEFFLSSLAWLEAVQPVVFAFQNTADGYKLLFDDGVFCEMAVFEAAELSRIPYSQARVVWQDEASGVTFAESNAPVSFAGEPPTQDWLLGEALCNLYVGLGRFRRGEKLTAARFIQGYAVERVLELAPFIEEEQAGDADPFDKDRRFERRFPQTGGLLADFMQGYEKSPESALAILAFLEAHFPIDQGMKEAISRNSIGLLPIR